MYSRSSNRFIPRVFDGFHCVGHIKSAHGLRGEIYIKLQVRPPDWLKSLNNFHILAPGEGSLKAWEIVSHSPHREGLIVKLKGCDDRNQSEALRKSAVYIPTSQLQAQTGDAIFLQQILQFKVIAVDDVPIGVITGFATNGSQDLLRIQKEAGGEALVPFIDEFVLHIDFDKQQVKMDLPPGLLDIEEE